jgi:hypothetical protein
MFCTCVSGCAGGVGGGSVINQLFHFWWGWRCTDVGVGAGVGVGV